MAVAFPMATIAGRLPGTNFQVCLAKLQNGTFGVGMDVGGTDNQGNPVDVANATGITYSLCLQACGERQEPFEFTIFSQQFSAFLLPWLALVSQLPFGSNDMLVNLDSVLTTVGSPTLAAYSLILTVLNNRWVTRQFTQYTFPNVRDAVRILTSLQQSPIRVVKDDGFLASLIVLSQNDKWWSQLAEEIDYSHNWSISAATSIAWVVIAYVFSVLDTFIAGVDTSIHSNGLGVGSLWLWLLPIVVGWLQFSPKCDAALLKKAVAHANDLAYLATDDGKSVLLKDKTDIRAIDLTLTDVDDLHRDEKCTSPVFNYARFFPMFLASGLALMLQWGTAGAAFVQAWYTPTRGLGCRSLAVLIYAVLSTTVWMMLVTSSILTHYASNPQHRSEGHVIHEGEARDEEGQALLEDKAIRHRSTARWISIMLRRLGKLIAGFNAVWAVTACFCQFGNVFDNCFCNSSVFSLGKHAYSVITLQDLDFWIIQSAWIGSVFLAGATAAIYVLFANFLIEPPLPEIVPVATE
ncbi:uncharacterized protein LACBIDRAFT_328972 [Laccaria bicolor S238N-H82]|uniref:Predicted protein n=1 Tax=Laccaria bicolor (strain S238N-H82 / ATCC MYA-4686) TaxID=486041 RepID=B0DGM4_LACBS|nr:uncharacterized protein LACBIDRAFT_328972 [Laccaria bicolor S238N-H82]EDR06177.1 predicted protein [Laccaria bicolor S238N-H82]|eukprot:XP_001883038.1 predicted protein [Laccaria bicolor S238N-H82]